VCGAFGGVSGATIMSILSDIVPPQRRAAGMGVIMAAFAVAAALGVPIGLYLAQKFRWEMPFLLVAGMAVIIWILILIILPPVRGHLEETVGLAARDHHRDLFQRRRYALDRGEGYIGRLQQQGRERQDRGRSSTDRDLSAAKAIKGRNSGPRPGHDMHRRDLQYRNAADISMSTGIVIKAPVEGLIGHVGEDEREIKRPGLNSTQVCKCSLSLDGFDFEARQIGTQLRK